MNEREHVPGLSDNDPQPESSRRGPPVGLVILIVIAVIVVVALHVAGVVGPGSH
jgi:hypothetical protein